MSNLIQTELDMAEEYVLTCLFGCVHNPQVNPTIKSFLTIKGQHLHTVINEYIDKFEELVKPLLKENGYIDGEKLSKLLEHRINQKISLGDFRLIDAARALEPQLMLLKSFIQ